LIQLDRVLGLNEGPVDALQDALLNCLLVALQCSNKVLHVCLDEEYFSFFLLAECIQLQHLNQTLTSFFNDCHLKMLRQKLHTYVEVAKNVIDVSRYFTLSSLDNFIEATEQMMIDIEEKLDAPFFFVGEHCLDQLVCFIDDLVLTELGEA